MTTETAIMLNSAASYIGLYLDGFPGATETHVEIVRTASLAQLQTAREVVEAMNQQPAGPDGRKTIHCMCCDSLLERVKAWADAQPGTKY